MKTALTGLGTLLGIVVIVSGFLTYAGMPPYANHDWAVEKIGGLEIGYLEQRLDSIERRIFDMEMQKQKMGRDWPPRWERELRRLYRMRDNLRLQIRNLIGRQRR